MRHFSQTMFTIQIKGLIKSINRQSLCLSYFGGYCINTITILCLSETKYFHTIFSKVYGLTPLWITMQYMDFMLSSIDHCGYRLVCTKEIREYNNQIHNKKKERKKA